MKKTAIGCPREETAQLKHSGDKWTPGVRHQIRHHTHHWHHSLLSKTVPSTELLFAISLKGILPVSNYPWDCKYTLSLLMATEPHCSSHIWVSFGAQLELSKSEGVLINYSTCTQLKFKIWVNSQKLSQILVEYELSTPIYSTQADLSKNSNIWVGVWKKHSTPDVYIANDDVWVQAWS